MKTIFLLPFFLFGLNAYATDYYISATGNDSNNGTSSATPWRTLNKVNAFFSSIKAGDNILLNRGDTFYGSINATKSGASGNPITFGAYGTGAKPIITGFTTVTSWTNLGGNIWESTSAVSTLSTLKTVVINGVNTPVGRFPNGSSASPFLNYFPIESVGSNSITSTNLAGVNWTGAQVVMRLNHWTLTNRTITSQSGNTINFTAGYAWEAKPTVGWGFFIQNDPKTLDVQNEWSYNSSTKKIRIYNTSMPTNVQVTTVGALFSASNQTYITIDGIDFRGANESALSFSNSPYITIRNCNISYTGNFGMNLGEVSNYGIVQNNNFTDCGSSSIMDDNNTGVTITGNTINRSGIVSVIKQGDFDGATISVARNGTNSLIANNNIDSSAQNGISFRGANAQVRNNFINHSAMIRDDAGGIYTGYVNEAGKVIDGNIVLNSIGNASGVLTGDLASNGIYVDDFGNNVTVTNNTIANCSSAGLFLHITKNVTVRNNTVYNCGTNNWTRGSFMVQSGSATNEIGYVRDNRIVNNIFFSRNLNQVSLFYYATDPSNVVANFGTLDSNYYAKPIDNTRVFDLDQPGTGGMKSYNLAQWKSLSGQDANSKESPKTITDVNDLRFEYNATTSARTVTLDANYIDVKGKSYDGTVTLSPYTSVILIKNGVGSNIPPAVNAGANKTITLPTSTVGLSGSGSDADGTISNYLWTKTSGPSTYKIVNAGSPVTDVTGLVEGIYQFELKVTDDKGAVGRDTVQVTVNAAANISPTANAGANKTITLPTSTVGLSGSGSDADGTISNYLWTKTSGPSTYKIVNAGSPVTDVTGLVEGIYQFELKVTDDKGAEGRDTVQVTVNAEANIPPTANAGANKTITLPTNSTSLSGSGSDADGTISNYLWTKTSGPSTYNIVNAGSPLTDVTGLVEGVYQLELSVTDDKGAVGKDTVQITVNAEANIPPTANAGTNKTITLPTNSTSLSGSGSDSDGTISNYLWTKTSGPSTYNIVNAGSPVTDVTGLVEGIYQFELKVTDDKGAAGRDTVQVTVNAEANIPPTANAGANKTITLPTNSTSLSGSGSDADGTISNYLWTKTSGPSTYNIVNAGSPVSDVTGLVEGVYQFELKVTDDKGATATSTMEVTVNAATVANIPPTASAGPNKTITLPTNSTSLSGSGSDVDGTISNYLWTKISGPSKYKIANTSSPVTDIKGLEQGVYHFELKVTDDKGATATSTVLVTVNAATNISPRANAGGNKKITLPTSTTSLEGSGSDTDGTITNYKWTKTSGPSTYNIVNPESPVTDVTGLEEGVYQFELEVIDNDGAIATSTVEVTVDPAANISPTANAGASKTITLPTNSTSLAGSGSDTDGTIANYFWTKISGPSTYNIVNAGSPVTDVTGFEEGVYQFELKVTDNQGGTATSVVQITVSAAPSENIAPIANAGTDATITLPVNFVNLSGNGMDADGAIAKYQWKQISGPSEANITYVDKAGTSVNNLTGGTYQFEFAVTDNKGATGKDTMVLVVALGRMASPGSNNLKVYPNPVRDIATVGINTIETSTDLVLTISDINGRVIYKKVLKSTQNVTTEKINMTNYAKGTYMITVTFNEVNKQTFKILKL